MNVTTRLFLIALCCTGHQCVSQGTFGNLDFERGRLVPYPNNPNMVYASSALPGWQVYIFGNVVTAIVHDSVCLGSACIGIHDLNTADGIVPILQGEYSLFFQRGVPSSEPIPYITQTRILPDWGRSIRFLTGSETSPEFSIYLDGQQLDVVPLHERLFNGYVWGANFDPEDFGGGTVELRISGSGVLDNVFFSGVVVPEPTSFGLGGIMATSLWFRRRSRRRDRQ